MYAEPYRASDFGPRDDPYEMRYQAALDELQSDADEERAVIHVVARLHLGTLRELLSGAYTPDGSKAIGRQICEAAEAEWDARARARLDRQDEAAAERRAGYR